MDAQIANGAMGLCLQLLGVSKPKKSMGNKQEAAAICREELRKKIKAIQQRPPNVGPEAAALIREKGMERKSGNYMRHWLCCVRAEATREMM